MSEKLVLLLEILGWMADNNHKYYYVDVIRDGSGDLLVGIEDIPFDTRETWNLFKEIHEYVIADGKISTSWIPLLCQYSLAKEYLSLTYCCFTEKQVQELEKWVVFKDKPDFSKNKNEPESEHSPIAEEQAQKWHQSVIYRLLQLFRLG